MSFDNRWGKTVHAAVMLYLMLIPGTTRLTTFVLMCRSSSIALRSYQNSSSALVLIFGTFCRNLTDDGSYPHAILGLACKNDEG